MFARLRKLQFFKAVESCTGGYGRFRCQRVNRCQTLGYSLAKGDFTGCLVPLRYCPREILQGMWYHWVIFQEDFTGCVVQLGYNLAQGDFIGYVVPLSY